MTFILGEQRSKGSAGTAAAFHRYQDYLTALRDRFPPRAFALATAAWYHDPTDHRCPHDAWLDNMTVSEVAQGYRQEQRILTMSIRLLGAYHDGHLEFRYPQVFRYELGVTNGELGHRDWRYDEFRLTEGGHVIHEIEWSADRSTGRWLIEASDVDLNWVPDQ